MSNQFPTERQVYRAGKQIIRNFYQIEQIELNWWLRIWKNFFFIKQQQQSASDDFPGDLEHVEQIFDEFCNEWVDCFFALIRIPITEDFPQRPSARSVRRRRNEFLTESVQWIQERQ